MIIWVCVGREDTRMGLIARWLLLAALSATVTYRPGMIPIVPLEMSHIHTTDCSTGMELLELPDSRVCMKNKGIAGIA